MNKLVVSALVQIAIAVVCCSLVNYLMQVLLQRVYLRRRIILKVIGLCITFAAQL